MTDIPEDDFTPHGIKRVISANYDLLDAWYAARGITTERMEMKATIARLEADRAAQAERMARLEEALRNLAHEMRFLLRNKPRMDGGLYRQRLSEADAALAEFGACKHNCDVGGICLAEHAGFPESCARASQEGSDA